MPYKVLQYKQYYKFKKKKNKKKKNTSFFNFLLNGILWSIQFKLWSSWRVAKSGDIQDHASCHTDFGWLLGFISRDACDFCRKAIWCKHPIKAIKRLMCLSGIKSSITQLCPDHRPLQHVDRLSLGSLSLASWEMQQTVAVLSSTTHKPCLYRLFL